MGNWLLVIGYWLLNTIFTFTGLTQNERNYVITSDSDVYVLRTRCANAKIYEIASLHVVTVAMTNLCPADTLCDRCVSPDLLNFCGDCLECQLQSY